MAARLLCSGEFIIASYARNLRWLCTRTRNFSSQGRNNSNEPSPPPADVKEVTGEPIHPWLNIKAGIFGPSDQRLPLPGDVGLGQPLDGAPQIHPIHKTPIKKFPADVLTTVTNHEQQILAINQVKSAAQLKVDLEIENLIKDMSTSMVHAREVLECRAQDCPELVKKDFADLFPGRNLNEAPLSVLTLSQNTEFDMSGWSEDMESEREELIDCFVHAADEICLKLVNEGYWADFIDPSSGRPYHGPYTNATLFETDERYRHMGFQIEDLGCCKVISHRVWGPFVFVGAIFTNAPVNSPVIEDIISMKIKLQPITE